MEASTNQQYKRYTFSLRSSRFDLFSNYGCQFFEETYSLPMSKTKSNIKFVTSLNATKHVKSNQRFENIDSRIEEVISNNNSCINSSIDSRLLPIEYASMDNPKDTLLAFFFLLKTGRTFKIQFRQKTDILHIKLWITRGLKVFSIYFIYLFKGNIIVFFKQLLYKHIFSFSTKLTTKIFSENTQNIIAYQYKTLMLGTAKLVNLGDFGTSFGASYPSALYISLNDKTKRNAMGMTRAKSPPFPTIVDSAS